MFKKRFPLSFSMLLCCLLCFADVWFHKRLSCRFFHHLHNENCYSAGRAYLQPFPICPRYALSHGLKVALNWLNRCCFTSDHCTKTLLFKLVLVTNTSMNHLPLPMVMLYGPNDWNFPWLERVFPEERIRWILGENPVRLPSSGKTRGASSAGAAGPVKRVRNFKLKFIQ